MTLAAVRNVIAVLILVSRVAAMSSIQGGPASLSTAVAATASCPCSDASLCRPVTTQHRREVFGFAVLPNTSYDRRVAGRKRRAGGPHTGPVHRPSLALPCTNPCPSHLHPHLVPPPLPSLQLRLEPADHSCVERRPAPHVHSARSGGARRARRAWRQLARAVCQPRGAHSVDSRPRALRPGASPGWNQL